jgi:mRNA interferase MazF
VAAGAASIRGLNQPTGTRELQAALRGHVRTHMGSGIAAFAAETARTHLDLDIDLESAGVLYCDVDGFNQTPGWKSIIVVPISTSSSQGKRRPTVIELSGGTGGLAKTSFAVCHPVITLDRAKLTKRIGTLPAEALREVEEGLRAAMDLD